MNLYFFMFDLKITSSMLLEFFKNIKNTKRGLELMLLFYANDNFLLGDDLVH